MDQENLNLKDNADGGLFPIPDHSEDRIPVFVLGQGARRRSD